MKVVTSVTMFNDAVGLRMSMTYSEVNDETGEVVSDNKRIDRVVTSETIQGCAEEVFDYAKSFIDMLE